MLLDLTRFRGPTAHLERRYEPSAFDLSDDEFRIVSPVVLVADVRKGPKKVRLEGRVTATIELDCGRCLEPLAAPVDAAFDLVYLPAALNRGEPEAEVTADDLGVSYYADDAIDLGQVMREQFYLALPMKPLCREDCKGLCPECGINRNRETCTCRREWTDPRLEALRKLKEPN
jgi:uncharacterized protein